MATDPVVHTHLDPSPWKRVSGTKQFVCVLLPPPLVLSGSKLYRSLCEIHEANNNNNINDLCNLINTHWKDTRDAFTLTIELGTTLSLI